ncbi:hypothetical protein BROUX41_001738 [Berkeleyomyces rouxiae]|uniref:uncharacterized protein n=1 Tax=Berkeleyomyces rouxiae TaxID=2035830 RepID=UPI003B7F0048
MAVIPAWKRLGLKLKGASGSESSPAPSSAPTPASAVSSSPTPPAKRKYDSATGSNNTPLRSSLKTHDYSTTDSGFKKPRHDSNYGNSETHASNRYKSVSFSADTTLESHTGAGNTQTLTPAKKPKKLKTKKSKTAGSNATTSGHSMTTDITPSLEYLRLWKTNRTGWKFNKNHQTLLIKYVYDGSVVPSRDMTTFYEYIRDIQGYARVRLLNVARSIQQADMEHVTGEAPLPGTAPTPPTAAQMAANVKYHVRLAECMRGLTVQTSKDGVKHIDESQIEADQDAISNSEGAAMVKRIIKRMRAEGIIAELAENTEAVVTEDSGLKMETKKTVSQDEEEKEAKPATATQVKPNGKKVRSRKKRVTADSDTSSSESDSDSSDSDSD